METLEINKIGGLGASEISALFTKEGIKAKTAQTLAYEKAKELITGEKKNFTTAAMQHGLFNESDAFEMVVKEVFPTAVYQADVSFEIEKGLWATPDVIDPIQEITIDIKCPYTIYTYFQNIKKVSASYLAQVQMQMMATGFNKGYLMFYLTSNVIDEWGNKIEFDIDINDRHKFIEIDANKEFQKEILERAKEFFELRDLIKSHLEKAPLISDMEYFNLAKSDHRVTRFKDKTNLKTWEGKIYNNFREGYIVIE